MVKRPERLDIQLRQSLMRRRARTTAIVSGLALNGVGVYEVWTILGWHWWYVPATILLMMFALWIARLDADASEELTRWFWRPPK